MFKKTLNTQGVFVAWHNHQIYHPNMYKFTKTLSQAVVRNDWKGEEGTSIIKQIPQITTKYCYFFFEIVSTLRMPLIARCPFYAEYMPSSHQPEGINI